MTGVVPVSGGRIVLFGAMFGAGRITPSVRSRRSLKVSPGRIDPVERGSWRGSGGVLVSGVEAFGGVGAGACAKAIAPLRHQAAKAAAYHRLLRSKAMIASPARRRPISSAHLDLDRSASPGFDPGQERPAGPER
jgi:hypothetical protein